MPTCASPVESGGSCPAADVLESSVDRPNLVPGVAAGAGIMLLSAIDAALYAGRQNRERDRLRDQPWTEAAPALAVGAGGALEVGWSVRVR